MWGRDESGLAGGEAGGGSTDRNLEIARGARRLCLGFEEQPDELMRSQPSQVLDFLMEGRVGRA